MHTTPHYQVKLNDGQTLTIQRVIDLETDFTEDQALGVAAFVNAYKDNPLEEIQEHFQSRDKIKDYYHNLIEECDIAPFRAGKLIWIRAFLDNKLVGWMGLEPDFREKYITYISTFVLSPTCENYTIGAKMLYSITAHWQPESDELNLVVRKINHKALNFFAYNGFVPDPSIVHHYVDNPLHCIFMRRLGV